MEVTVADSELELATRFFGVWHLAVTGMAKLDVTVAATEFDLATRCYDFGQSMKPSCYRAGDMR